MAGIRGGLAALALVLIPAVGSAQYERRLTLLGGVNLGTVGGQGAEDFGTRSMRVGPIGGLGADLYFRPRVAFAPELFLSIKGVKGSTSEGSSNLEMHYLEIPLLLKYALPVGGDQLHPDLFAGPALAIRTTCTVEVTQPVSHRVLACHDVFLNKTGDVSFVAGGDLRVGVLLLSARYDLGLGNLNGEPGGAPIRSRTLSLLAGVSLLLRR
jgi:hypothetical protein